MRHANLSSLANDFWYVFRLFYGRRDEVFELEDVRKTEAATEGSAHKRDLD